MAIKKIMTVRHKNEVGLHNSLLLQKTNPELKAYTDLDSFS